jgi:pimeloyl-ACP methyl ester carboxylesterase
MDEIYREDRPALRPRLLQSIDHAGAELQAVSPAGHLQDVRVPVLLLHGKGDSLIPASETLWLARGLPPHVVKAMLISPALSHVDLEDKPTLRDHWELVHWVAVLLQTLDQTSKPQ